MIGQPLRLTQAAAAAMIADTSKRFLQGQKIEYTDATSGGVVGIICTTAGIGGTAVFKAFGVIAA